jgi:hypothetical protein
MIRRWMAGAIVAAALAGCAPMRIDVDYDPSARFDGLRSWDWASEAPKRTGNPRIDNSLFDARVRRAVEERLAAQGYERREAAPDFLVEYHAALDRRLDARQIYTGFGYGPGYWGPYGDVQTIVREYEQGTLILDVLDPRERRLLWRGVAEAEVYPTGSPEERAQRIAEAVRRILERFPPAR